MRIEKLKTKDGRVRIIKHFTISERVTRGIDLLDHLCKRSGKENWRSLIDIDKIEFSPASKYHLFRQLFGNVKRAYHKMILIGYLHEYGINTSFNEDDTELKKEWIKRLQTNKDWENFPILKKKTIRRVIKGVNCIIGESWGGDGLFYVSISRGKRVYVFPNNYKNIDSAKRAVRKYVQDNKI